MEKAETLYWSYCRPCEVYGKAVIKACWNCGDDEVKQASPIITNADTVRFRDGEA